MVVTMVLFHAFALLASWLSVRPILELLVFEVWIFSVAFVLALAIGMELLGLFASRPVTISSDLGGLTPCLPLVSFFTL